MTHAPASGPLPDPATVPVIAPARPAVPDGAFKPLPPGATPDGPCRAVAGWFTCFTALALACAEAIARPLTRAVHARPTGISRSFIAAATRRSWLSYTLRPILLVSISTNISQHPGQSTSAGQEKPPLADVPSRFWPLQVHAPPWPSTVNMAVNMAVPGPRSSLVPAE